MNSTDGKLDNPDENGSQPKGQLQTQQNTGVISRYDTRLPSSQSQLPLPSLKSTAKSAEHFQWPYQALAPVHEFFFVVLLVSSQLLTQAAFGATLIPYQPLARGLGVTSPGQLA